MSTFNQQVNNGLSFLNGTISHNAINLLAVLYGSMAAPQLPYQLAQLFEYAIFRFLVLFTIVWNNSRNPMLAVRVSVGILVVFYLFSYYEPFRIDQNTNVHPGCLGLTMDNVLEVFNGDTEAMHLALYNTGLPRNIPLNDEFAPLIASHLISKGYDLGESCNLTNDQYLH